MSCPTGFPDGPASLTPPWRSAWRNRVTGIPTRPYLNIGSVLRKNSRYRCHVRRWVERYCVRVGREKKTLYASERDEQARREWRTTIQGEVADQLVFVDESSTHVAMTPLYARTLRGTRAYGAVPRNKGANISLLAALTPQGLTAALTVEGAVDRPVFERYVEQVLIPQLTSGQTVVMDNLSVHKSARVAQLLHDHGCTLRFLPTYSPDLAPVEGGFGKVKTLVRHDQPRTREALDQSIGRALTAISPQDAQGWFHRCGYILTRQPL